MNTSIPPFPPDPDDGKTDLIEDLSITLSPLYRSKTFNYLGGLGPEAWSFLAIASVAAVVLGISLFFHLPWLGIPAALIAIALAGRILLPTLQAAISEWLPRPLQLLLVATGVTLFGILGILQFSGATAYLTPGDRGIN
ncbi:MAG: hypothetical protein HC852_17210, partial [Acaryochloridaceae cyanobacterium RU_4_10]|nr:hypothetical protein [Acaryochloridaceae cyanobacterium RU_4_10]